MLGESLHPVYQWHQSTSAFVPSGIVCTKARTHKVQDPKFRKFKEKCGPRLQMKVNCLEEKLD